MGNLIAYLIVKKVLVSVLISLTALFLVVGGVVRAEDSSNSDDTSTYTPEATHSPKPENLFGRFGKKVERLETSRTGSDEGDLKERGKHKLSDLKLRSCEARQNAIKKRMASLLRLTTSMLAKFDAFAIRVEEFYINKVVPSGKTISNYDALVADIAAKKAAVNEAITKAQTDSDGFVCTGDDPKGTYTLFRQDMQAVKEALHNYRKSIKNLIKAIHEVVDDTDTESPEPSATPEATATP